MKMKTGVVDQFINNHLKYFTILYKRYTGRLSYVHISDSLKFKNPYRMKDGMKNQDDDGKEEIFVLRPYTHKELAQLYNVCWLTFQRWVKKNEKRIGKKQGHFYHIHQVLKIFKIYGIPKRFKISLQEVEEMFKG